MSSSRVVLILGSADDEHAVHIYEQLRRHGQQGELLDSRAFPAELAIAYDPVADKWTLRLPSGRRLIAGDVASIYWRSYNGLGWTGLVDEEQAYIAENDARSLFESFLIRFPARWVNGWAAFQLHQTKPAALARVAALGVAVPPTLLGNDADALREFAAAHAQVVFKPVQGGDETRRLRPEHLTAENLASLCHAPVTVQAEVPGTNVRVFVAGEHVMACKVRTAELDYRQSPAPQLLVHDLPQSVAELSRRLAGELGLLWTGIDFRLTPAGEYVFLEANPSPMFLGFERATGLPLTERLLELLTAP